MTDPHALWRITARAEAVADARAAEAQVELKALAEHMRRSIGQHVRYRKIYHNAA